jgi:hypothetical protein
VLAVEWGERLPPGFRREALELVFEPGEGDARRLLGSARAGRGLELLAAWTALAGVVP